MKRKNIPIGARFGRLVVHGDMLDKRSQRKMRCICDCGNARMVAPYDLRKGRVKSCGCAKRERAREMGEKNKTHGHSTQKVRSPTYLTWQSMMQRCYESKVNGFSNYGGIGISVEDRWHNFANFLDDMGERPSGMTLDRIDVRMGYFKENCRWATKSEQNNNRRNTRFIEYMGEVRPAAEWAKIFNTHINNIYRRHARGAALDGS